MRVPVRDVRCVSARAWCLAATASSLLAGLLQARSPTPAEPNGLRRALPVSPLPGFVANFGQWPDGVAFDAMAGGVEASVCAGGIVLRPLPELDSERGRAAIVLRLPGDVEPIGEGLLPTEVNFLRGEASASHVPAFTQVRYRDLVPGIDLVLRAGATGFEYDLHVAPGADLGALVLGLQGGSGLSLRADGTLELQGPEGPVTQRIGASWQLTESGARECLSAAFRVLPPEGDVLRFGFEVPDRDPGRAFVLDPTLVFSGNVAVVGFLADMAVTPEGEIYLLSKAYTGAPTTPGAFQSAALGTPDAWIGHLSSGGTALVWATYLGGSKTDDPKGLAVGQDGSVVVMGNCFSPDFPTTRNCLQPVFAGGNDDLFVTRLASDGASLVWSTFYGGSSSELGSSVALFPDGDVLIAAHPNGSTPPATPGAFDTTYAQGLKDFLARISADGSQLRWQTYFGGGIDVLRVDATSRVYLAGGVGASQSFPVTPGVLKEVMPQGDTSDGFLASLSGSGDAVDWATYLGGAAPLKLDTIYGLDVDAAGATYVCGVTESPDFPVTTGAFDATYAPPGQNFVAKILPEATGIAWATFITSCCGGSSILWELRVDSAGNAIVVGESNQPNFPVTPDAFQPFYVGGSSSSYADAHLTKFDAFGESLVYSTYFGGNGSDGLSHVGLDGAQRAYLGIHTSSTDLPVTPGAYGYGFGTGGIGIAEFDLGLAPWAVLGGGLKGAQDIPNLAGAGAMTAGATTRLSLRGAAPSAAGFLVAGLTQISAPFKGGTLVPAPDVVLPVAVTGQGSLDLIFPWPAGVPAGIGLTVQTWVQDAGAVHGWSASNALEMTAQ